MKLVIFFKFVKGSPKLKALMFTKLKCYEFKMTYNVVMCGTFFFVGEGVKFLKTGIGHPPSFLENFSGSGHDGTAIKFSNQSGTDSWPQSNAVI